MRIFWKKNDSSCKLKRLKCFLLYKLKLSSKKNFFAEISNCIQMPSTFYPIRKSSIWFHQSLWSKEVTKINPRHKIPTTWPHKVNIFIFRWQIVSRNVRRRTECVFASWVKKKRWNVLICGWHSQLQLCQLPLWNAWLAIRRINASRWSTNR